MNCLIIKDITEIIDVTISGMETVFIKDPSLLLKPENDVFSIISGVMEFTLNPVYVMSKRGKLNTLFIRVITSLGLTSSMTPHLLFVQGRLRL